MWPSLYIALQFLTTIPLPGRPQYSDADIGRSLLWYPAVGLLIGALLWLLLWLLSSAPTLLTAALLLFLWVAISGGLHLDGLADSADAWMGGLGSRERTLAIMKDPCCGPIAVVVLMLLLLVKFAALVALVDRECWIVLLVIPVISRSALPLLFMSTPYVRVGGLGSLLSEQLPRQSIVWVLLSALLLVMLFGGGQGLLLMVAAGLLFLLLRRVMLRRVGGMTGDTAGAVVELLEGAMLVVAVLSNTSGV